MGRHKKEITPAQWKKAGQYALDGCQNNTICGLMDWDDNFIDQREDLRKFLTKKRQERKLKILRGQNKRSLEGSDTMLIWQGKNVLDQTDKQELDHRGQITVNIVNFGDGVPSDGCDQSPV